MRRRKRQASIGSTAMTRPDVATTVRELLLLRERRDDVLLQEGRRDDVMLRRWASTPIEWVRWGGSDKGGSHNNTPRVDSRGAIHIGIAEVLKRIRSTVVAWHGSDRVDWGRTCF